MDIVVDVECFANEVIKELAFAHKFFSVKDYRSNPPFSDNVLTSSENTHNTWLSSNLHKINWNSGAHHYCDLKEIIQFMKIESREVVYHAKGIHNVYLLTKLFGVPFTNLDDLGCPNIYQLCHHDRQVLCESFPNIHQGVDFYHCAQKKASYYLEWLIGQKLIENFEKIEVSKLDFSDDFD